MIEGLQKSGASGRQSVAAAGLVVTWSAGFIGAALGTRAGEGPLTVLAWRYALLSGILFVACLISATSLASWAAWKRQFRLALLSQAGYVGLVFVGISYGVHGGTTALIAALQPLLVMTVAGRVLGEATNRAAWIGTALGFVGVFVVVSTEMRADHAPTWVYIFPSLAMLSLTVGTILSKKMNPPETLLQTITMQAVVSAVTFALVATLTGQAHVPINVDAWAAIAWLILIPSIAGYGLYVYVTHASGATAVSTLLYLTPPTTMLWAHLMFGDPIYLTALLGLGISALGVFLVLRAKNPTMSRT